MNGRPLLLAVLGLVAIGALWRLEDQTGIVRKKLERRAAEAAKADSVPAASSPGVQAETQAQPASEEEEEKGPPVAREVPTWPEVPEAERFPLSADAKPLDEAPPVPEGKPAPVLFLAPTYTDHQTSASYAFEWVYRSTLQAALPDRLLLNLIPWSHMQTPYEREGVAWTVRDRTAEEYLRDARRLDADFLVLSRAVQEGETLTAELTLTDLRTSRSEERKTSRPVAEADALMRESVATTARFCGLTDEEIAAAGMDRNLAGPRAWELLNRATAPPIEVYDAALEAEPDCVPLHDAAIGQAGHEALAYVNRALEKWPNDLRLLLTKSKLLTRKKKGEGALLLHSELLRRYPLSLFLHQSSVWTLDSCYPGTSDASKPPTPYLAVQKAAWNATLEYPKNWGLHWDHGLISRELAHYVRGTRTADRIPPEIWKLFQLYSGQGQRSMDRAMRLNSDSPELLQRVLEAHFSAGEYSDEWMEEMVDRIRELDPSNVEAELAMAYSRSVGWSGDGSGYLPVIEEAVKRHAGNTRAMHRIAASLAQDLCRIPNFTKATKTEVLAPNRESELFREIAEELLEKGEDVDDMVVYTLGCLYQERGQAPKASTLQARVRNVYEEPKRLMDAKQFEQALAMARERLKKAHSTDGRHWLRYVIVKSLWKMGRHEESLTESEAGIAEYQQRHTFHYMFAIVALEKGIRLKEALHHAEVGLPFDPQNQGLKETLEKLREKVAAGV